MASDEFRAFQAAMASRPAAPPASSLAEQRQRIDDMMGALPLAEGVEAVEVDLAGVRAIECRPVEMPESAPTLLYLHGGGFRIASALAYRAYGSQLARVLGGRVVLVDYRLAPEHPYPAALDDAVTAFRALIDAGTDPARIVVAGDSAGGGLAASLILRVLAEQGAPRPAAAVCCSPLADLTVTSPTYDSNAATDQLFSRAQANAAAEAYLGDHDPADPMVSPLFGAWASAPPVLVQVGDIEVLLDDALRLAEALRAAGVDTTLHVYPDMPHIWPMSYPAFPEAVEAVEEIAAFVHRHVG